LLELSLAIAVIFTTVPAASEIVKFWENGIEINALPFKVKLKNLMIPVLLIIIVALVKLISSVAL